MSALISKAPGVSQKSPESPRPVSTLTQPEGPLPTPVEVALEEPIRELWLRRVRQHMDDTYAGVSMLQFPEDLRVFEHMLWLSRANTVIEIGTRHGGSALWFRDRLRALQSYRASSQIRVISIDLDTAEATAALTAVDPEFAQTVALVSADVRDPGLPERVATLLPAAARCLVVEDSAHTYETTRAALDGFARFVPLEGFFVVQDGCVDIEEMRPQEDWPRGVLPALHDWLATPSGRHFAVRRELELYGISCHPEGFLQRVSA